MIIILDGLENLRLPRSSTDSSLDWLTVTLPPRIHLIASLGGTHPHLEALTCKLSFIIDVPDLVSSGISDIIQDTVSQLNTQLSQEETTEVTSRVKANSRPLFLLLTLRDVIMAREDQSLARRSKRPAACSLHKLITARFKCIDRCHGKQVSAQVRTNSMEYPAILIYQT